MVRGRAVIRGATSQVGHEAPLPSCNGTVAQQDLVACYLGQRSSPAQLGTPSVAWRWSRAANQSGPSQDTSLVVLGKSRVQ